MCNLREAYVIVTEIMVVSAPCCLHFLTKVSCIKARKKSAASLFTIQSALRFVVKELGFDLVRKAIELQICI